jgi:hypothetical protein
VIWDKLILERLFVAVPELGADIGFVDALVSAGIISGEHVKIFRRLSRQHKVSPLRGRTLLQRIMVLAPEIISVRTVNLLARYNLIPGKEAHALRITLRVANRLLPAPLNNDRIYERMAMIFDDVFSSETVSYLRALDNETIDLVRDALLQGRTRLGSADAALIRQLLVDSIRRGQVLRSVISAGRITRDTIAEARALDDVWDVLGVTFDNLLGRRMLKNLVRAGVISPERYELWAHISELGIGVWRKAAAGRNYESWAARGLLLSEGVLSPELIKVLRDLGIISQRQATILYPVSTIMREITRGLGNKWRTSRRYRVVPGEAPIKTFARHSQTTDRAILKLLSQAADDASKQAETAMKTNGFAKLTRARQQQVLARELHKTMQDIWEGTGHLVIFGEKETAKAALEAIPPLQRLFGGNSDGQQLERSLLSSARSGVDSFISREEQLRGLSSRVWKNIALHSGRLDQEIAKGLLRGLSAQELAAVVRDYIRPDVRGGLSYAAMRLARTEINNAFHQTAIRYTREMPWVEGYQWHLSGSHPKTDICNDLAERNGGLGRGTYSKNNVPSKPHPLCLCYITPATVDNARFYRNLRSGAYDRYLDDVTRNGTFEETDDYTPTRWQEIAGGAAKVALVAGMSAAARRYLAAA